MSIVGGEGIEVGKKRCGPKAVDSGVDLPRDELLGPQGLLLDDGGYFRRGLAHAQYASVAGRIGGFGGKDGHCGVLAQMEGAHRLECGRFDERNIAGEHQEIFRWCFMACGKVRL